MPSAKAREKYVMFVISRYKFKADEQVIVLWELHWGDDRLFNSRSLSEIYSFKVISSMVVPKSLWLFYKNKMDLLHPLSWFMQMVPNGLT